uniref:Cytochrome b561 domain-containing protein n=2 Tax=Kalmanozyma brasiliensis (strain GHG001) TaxID=1365824 RepID=V5EUT4_KALBG
MNMTMTASGGGAPMGWYAVGTGRQMDGSNMMIGWVNTDGNVVMSQRTATGHSDPTTSINALTATMEPRHSFSNSSGTVWAWSFPMSGSESTPSSSTPFIWAANKNNNPASGTTSTIRRHTAYGSITLDLTKPYSTDGSGSNGGSSGGNGTPLTPTTGASQSNRILNRNNKLIIAHMVFMIIAWFLLVPAAILVGRYGRTFFKWLPVHRNLQIAAFFSVLIAFILIIVEVGSGEHFDSTHAKLGLAIFIVMILQMVLGMIGHKTKRFNVSRIVHVVIGLGITVAAVWNSAEGLSLWDWGPPRWASWILWIWFGVLAIAYLAGLALLPRDLRQWRESQGTSNPEKRDYLDLQHNPSNGASTEQPSPNEQPVMHPGWGAPPLQSATSQAYQSYSQPHTGNRI